MGEGAQARADAAASPTASRRGWYAGVEGRYASVYPNWTSGLDREAYAVSAGPTIHYEAKKWSATLTYLPQLFGSPSPGGSRALGEYEKRELRLKIGYEF